MRTPDDLNLEPFRPFGPKVTPSAPAPAQPEWKQVDGAAKGVQENREGRLRTDIPENDRCV